MSSMLFPSRHPLAWTSFALLVALGASRLGAQATMVHTLEAFHAPSAVVVLGDGKTLLIANTGQGEYGLTVGRGSISRVTLGADGQLAIEKLRFIEGLNGPVGLTLLATGSEALPAGTLVVTVGASWVVDAAGNPLLDDAARGTGLMFFDPQTGAARGRIFLGRGSAVEKIIGHPVADPTGITSDPAGNIYVLDVDTATTRSSRRGESKAGLIKFTRAALDALARGETPPADSVSFAAESNTPTALVYSSAHDALIWATFGGELRSLPQGDFSGRTAVITLNKESGTMVSLGITPKGEIIGASSDGLIAHLRGRKVKPFRFRKDPRFLSAGQPVIVRSADGRTLLILPEQGGGGVGPWRQRVNVIALSGDF